MKSIQTAPLLPLPHTQEKFPGKDLSITLTGLKHFTDYAITVCACTNAGCAQVSKGQILSGNCAVTKSRSDKKVDADDLGGPLTYSYNNTNWVVVSWVAPVDPNGKVLKYDLEYRDENKLTSRICVSSDQVKFRIPVTPGLNHTVRVRAITPAGNGSWSNEISFNLVGITKAQIGTPEGIDMKIIIGVSLAAFLIFAFGCGILIFFMSRKSDKNAPGVLYASVNPEYLNSNDVYIADEWEVPRDKIKLIKELGNGSFGMVYEGEATDLVPGQPRCKVAVKTVSENASIKDRIEFLQEASIMKAFNCNHVVRLLGVVSDGQPTLVIMELMESGDLKNFLRSRRPEEENSMPAPLLPEFLQMAAEICDGMAYLADRKFVHRDLAARNCMVSGDYIVKIGDFGMTRDIYETDYYRKGGRGLLPVRWMAPESLRDGVFTTSSDVWSYGVVLWEMATLAAQPYPGMSNEEVLKYVVDGGVMSRPENCPDRLYDLMTLCWQYSNKTRPTFFSILELLENDVSDDFVERSFYLNDYKEQKELRENHHQHRHNSTEKPNRNINNSREHDLDHTPVPDVVEAPVIMRESMA